MKSTDWIKLGGCVAFAALLFTGCTSKPKAQESYTGILSSRGMLPPATVGGAPHYKPATVAKSAPAVVAPKEAEDEFALLPEVDNAAPKSDAPVVEPQPEIAPEVKAAVKTETNKNLPAAPVDGRKVPDFGGKSGKASAAAASTGTAVYVVKRGDIFSRIAHNHGLKNAELLAMNPSVKDPSKIIVGQKLNVPGNGAEAVRANASTASASKSSASVARESLPADGVYTVVANDSLWTIAKRFGVKRDEIKSWNNLSSDKLRVGQKLKLRADANVPASAGKSAAPVKAAPVAPEAKPVEAAPAPAPVVENPPVDGPVVTPAQQSTAQDFTSDWGINDENDTLENIASQMGCSVDDLLRLNPNIKSDADLKIGTTIKVPLRVVE